ncbi:phosphate ABC transporter permease, partial [Methylococcaceae bacterium HT3]
MRAEQWEDALDHWELVRTRFPDAPSGYHRAAEAARKIGNYKLARKLLLSLEYGEQDRDDELIVKKTPSRVIGHGHPINLIELIWTKAIFNLRSEGQRNYLSYAWLLLEPILHIL